MSTYAISNEGIGGGPFLTMTLNETAPFDQSDIDGNSTACSLSGNNEVAQGDAGVKLFGKVVWVSTDFVAGTVRPATCAVQARGVARFEISGTAPDVNGMVELAGGGKVRKATASETVPAGGHLNRGQVIAVNAGESWCDVWLG